MKSSIHAAKAILSPPGDTLLEHIEWIGMSQAELAERMGRPKEKINDIIKGREPITTATAFQLEKVIGIPASVWLNREFTYRKELYEIQQQEKFKQDKMWLSKFPIQALQQLGYLPMLTEKHLLVDHLLKFFSVASPDEWERIYMKKGLSVSFRCSLAQTSKPHAIAAWLRMGEQQGFNLQVAPFNKKQLKTDLDKMLSLTHKNTNDYFPNLQALCAKSGVAVVLTPGIPQANILGAVRWFHQMPLLQLSDRLNNPEQFRFTFFHEIAHILLHGKKEVFLEHAAGAKMDKRKEKEADGFAMQIMNTKSLA